MSQITESVSRSENWIDPVLYELAVAGLERKTIAHPISFNPSERKEGAELLNFASNDYLALASHPTVVEAVGSAAKEYGAGTGSARLLSGTTAAHQELEAALAGFGEFPSALVFGAGYLANLGAIPALVGRGDTVIADRLVHASLVDGMVLSRARLHRFRHNDTAHLEQILRSAKRSRRAGEKVLVVTESVFSMDGDLAPLAELAELAERFEALLMIDEAHAFGVFGPAGAGRVVGEQLASQVNLVSGTLSKSFGSYGGFILSSSAVTRLLINKARTFIFNTALPVPCVRAGQRSLELLKGQEGLGRELLQRANFFRAALCSAGICSAGIDAGESGSQIVPVLIGDSDAAVAVSNELRERGILTPAIRPPTVPQGTPRLRFSITLHHSISELEWVAATVGEVISNRNNRGST